MKSVLPLLRSGVPTASITMFGLISFGSNVLQFFISEDTVE